MNKYKLVSNHDANISTELEARTFQEAVDETLERLGWFLVDEGDHYVALCGDGRVNDEIALQEHVYEDAQYEAIEQLGYFISSQS